MAISQLHTLKRNRDARGKAELDWATIRRAGADFHADVLDNHRHAIFHLDDGDRLFEDRRWRRALAAEGDGGGQEAAVRRSVGPA